MHLACGGPAAGRHIGTVGKREASCTWTPYSGNHAGPPRSPACSPGPVDLHLHTSGGDTTDPWGCGAYVVDQARSPVREPRGRLL